MILQSTSKRSGDPDVHREQSTIPIRRSLAVAVLSASVATSAFAQSGGGYTITKWTMDSGAISNAVGGNYVMSASLGQHDAAVLTGGQYVVIGGFWAPFEDTAVLREPTSVGGESGKNRFISLVVPTENAGQGTAIRVRLASIATPPGLPGGDSGYRYVNSFAGGVLDCADGPTFAVYKCARLGCQPEYRDWGTDVGGLPMHIVGDATPPGSAFAASMIPQSCGSAPSANTCTTSASTELMLGTSTWGDHVGPANGPPDNTANVLDISAVKNKLLAVPILFSEPLLWKKESANWNPATHPINVVDLGYTVDAVKNISYNNNGAFTITACP